MLITSKKYLSKQHLEWHLTKQLGIIAKPSWHIKLTKKRNNEDHFRKGSHRIPHIKDGISKQKCERSRAWSLRIYWGKSFQAKQRLWTHVLRQEYHQVFEEQPYGVHYGEVQWIRERKDKIKKQQRVIWPFKEIFCFF